MGLPPPLKMVFQFSDRTAARWITQGIAEVGLVTVATGTGVKGLGNQTSATAAPRHWLQSGLNVNAVSPRLGHNSPTVTLDTHLVLAPDTLWDIQRGYVTSVV